MTDINTVVRQLGDLARELDTAVAKLAELDEIRIDAEADFKAAEAQAFRAAEGSMELRKREALLACDELWRTWGKAESAVNVQKAHIRALHARVDVGRTIQSSIRAEIALAGNGGTP